MHTKYTFTWASKVAGPGITNQTLLLVSGHPEHPADQEGNRYPEPTDHQLTFFAKLIRELVNTA